MDTEESRLLPGWARVLDFVCLTLVLLALIIFLSGGFRVRVFDVRIALTSPVRLLVWALGLAILRHVLAPQRPIYADAPARVRAAWGTDEVRTAVAALVGTRFALFIGYLAIPLVGYPPPPPGLPPWRQVDNEFGNLLARWDVGWYLAIAMDGYSFDHTAIREQ